MYKIKFNIFHLKFQLFWTNESNWTEIDILYMIYAQNKTHDWISVIGKSIVYVIYGPLISLYFFWIRLLFQITLYSHFWGWGNWFLFNYDVSMCRLWSFYWMLRKTCFKFIVIELKNQPFIYPTKTANVCLIFLIDPGWHLLNLDKWWHWN